MYTGLSRQKNCWQICQSWLGKRNKYSCVSISVYGGVALGRHEDERLDFRSARKAFKFDYTSANCFDSVCHQVKGFSGTSGVGTLRARTSPGIPDKVEINLRDPILRWQRSKMKQSWMTDDILTGSDLTGIGDTECPYNKICIDCKMICLPGARGTGRVVWGRLSEPCHA